MIFDPTTLERIRLLTDIGFQSVRSTTLHKPSSNYPHLSKSPVPYWDPLTDIFSWEIFSWESVLGKIEKKTTGQMMFDDKPLERIIC